MTDLIYVHALNLSMVQKFPISFHPKQAFFFVIQQQIEKILNPKFY